MSLHAQLLEQACHLARRDPYRPRQVNLRRAVSAGYYALFHFLIDRAVSELARGTGNGQLRGVLARTFQHGTMRNASLRFAKGLEGLPIALRSALPAEPFPLELTDIAAAFSEAQQARHLADYDTTHRVARPDALGQIELVSTAIRDWPRISGMPATRLFLYTLLLGDRLRA